MSEKYRPQKISDMVGAPDLLRKLKSFVETEEAKEELPNLMFYGPPGTGKTTAAHCLVNEIYGFAKYPRRLDWKFGLTPHLEFNAAELRKDEVRNTITRIAAYHGSMLEIPVSYRLVIIDECEKMTDDVDALLRTIMEKYSESIRFTLICNKLEPDRPSAPIQSRCLKLRFERLSDEAITIRLKKIMSEESMVLNEDELREIVDEAYGDLRQAINMLQSRARPIEKLPEIRKQPEPEKPKIIKKRVKWVEELKAKEVERQTKPFRIPLNLLHWDNGILPRYHEKDLTLPIDERLKVEPCNCDKIDGPHYAVFEGYNRFKKMKESYKDETKVKVEVYYGLTRREKLEIILRSLEREPFTPIDECIWLEEYRKDLGVEKHEELAKPLGVTEGWVRQRFKALKLLQYIDRDELNRKIPRSFSKVRELTRFFDMQPFRPDLLKLVVKQITRETSWERVVELVDTYTGEIKKRKHRPKEPKKSKWKQEEKLVLLLRLPPEVEAVVRRWIKRLNKRWGREVSSEEFVARAMTIFCKDHDESFRKLFEEKKLKFKEWFEEEFKQI